MIENRKEQSIVALPPVQTKWNEVKFRAYVPGNRRFYIYPAILHSGVGAESMEYSYSDGVVETTVSGFTGNEEFEYYIELHNKTYSGRNYVGKTETHKVEL